MTVEEVAEYLRVKPSTVYDWAKRGKIPAVKIGRLWRFESEGIEAWIKSGMNEGVHDQGNEQ
jgi:PTS system nitrogen regulatory IIA component